MYETDLPFMHEALSLAKQAGENNEVPVGAVLVLDEKIIGRGANKPIEACDPTAHAEVLALREAAAHVGNYRIPNSTLYVTIEPCTMCVGALVHARVSRVVFGAFEPKAGMLSSNPELIEARHFNHAFEISAGVLEPECRALISGFFAKRRALKAQLKASTRS